MKHTIGFCFFWCKGMFARANRFDLFSYVAPNYLSSIIYVHAMRVLIEFIYTLSIMDGMQNHFNSHSNCCQLMIKYSALQHDINSLSTDSTECM